MVECPFLCYYNDIMKFKKATTQKEIFQLMRIRIDVFVIEQEVDPSIEIDDTDGLCDQYVLYDDSEQIVGTCRVIIEDDSWHVGRVAIKKEARKHQYGSYMLQQVEILARQANAKQLELGAQVTAMPFYERNGYVGFGDIFFDAHIEHKMMVKQL
ncbi:putative GNAT family N-acyltransferase [Breznakia blatticola]|uniref:Putative GNAT family N-acyltransferase n=2 Tax=Breznakia blatticola TaxID=1754012 RepID=A0A4R7ZRL6_9FIRM|nr:putative GNAT family N-acyltransferase [Breznakia blatticola]